MQAQQQLQDVGFEKEDAMAAVEKLHSVIEMVQNEMADAQEAADRLVIDDETVPECVWFLFTWENR